MVTGIKSPVPIFNVFFGQKFIAICNETIRSLTNQLQDFFNKKNLKGQTFFAHKNEIDGKKLTEEKSVQKTGRKTQ